VPSLARGDTKRGAAVVGARGQDWLFRYRIHWEG
jgi:hypothetical protein